MRSMVERLSEVSSCISKLEPHISCFCIEDNEQLASKCDADDHLFLAGSHQPLMEGGEVGIVASDCAGDEEQDVARPGTTATNRPATIVLAALVGDRRQAHQLG